MPLESQSTWGAGGVLENLEELVTVVVLRLEGRIATEEDVGDDPSAPDIAGEAVRVELLVHNFRRHVVRRAAELVESPSIGLGREAKV